MKKFMILMTSLVLSLTACSSEPQVGTFDTLPIQAQTFVTTYFDKSDIAFVLREREGFHYEYQVRLNDGTKIGFDDSGNLEWIDGQGHEIPSGIVPSPIVSYVKSHHPQNYITEYKVETRTLEVELDNHIEIEFDKSGNFVRYDW